MKKPLLVVITGRAGSGKTTLARELSKDAFIPYVSRDEIKEGYVHSFGKKHDELDQDESKLIVYNTFFDVVRDHLRNNVSVVCEAAFGQKAWDKELPEIEKTADIKMILCRPKDKLAMTRFIKRGLNNPKREYFHGDRGVDAVRQGEKMIVSHYDPPVVPYPTLEVDTGDGYKPGLDEIIKFVLQ